MWAGVCVCKPWRTFLWRGMPAMTAPASTRGQNKWKKYVVSQPVYTGILWPVGMRCYPPTAADTYPVRVANKLSHSLARARSLSHAHKHTHTHTHQQRWIHWGRSPPKTRRSRRRRCERTLLLDLLDQYLHMCMHMHICACMSMGGCAIVCIRLLSFLNWWPRGVQRALGLV